MPNLLPSWMLVLGVALVVPAILRVQRRKIFSDLPIDSRMRLAAASAVQDLIAGAQVAIILAWIGSMFAPPTAAATAIAVGFTLFHLFFLFDAALLTHFNCRFSFRFLAYARQLPLFLESSKKLGLDLRRIAAMAAAYLFILMVLFSVGFSRWGVPNVTVNIGILLVLLIGLGYCTLPLIPAEHAVQFLNSLLFRQGEWLRVRSPRPPENPGQVVAEFLAPDECAACDPSRPLLRRSINELGARRFDLALKDGGRPDVILLFLESFCAEPIGVIDEKTGASPEFDALSRDGILFRNFYGNGVQTARAVMSSLFGIPPRLSVMPAQSDLRNCPRLLGLPHFFSELGYRNSYHHNGSLAFDAQDFFFPRQRYDELYGRDQIKRRFPEADLVGGWGLPDEFLMRHFADWLAAQRSTGQPSFSTLFTMTNHHPFEVPAGFSPPIFNYPGNPEKEMFLATFAYTDYCLRLLVRLLQEKGLYENTLLMILADTAQPLGRHDNWTEQRFLFEDNLRVPLLILGPSLVREPMIIDEPCSQLDLMATALDLFRRPSRHHSIGKSLARINPDRRIHCNNPFGNQWLAERKGPLKIIHELRTGQTLLFDVVADPLETNDLASQRRSLVATWREHLLRANSLFSHLYAADRFC